MKPGFGIRDWGFGKADWRELLPCAQSRPFKPRAAASAFPESRIPNPESRQQGFTLLEMLVVILLIGIAAVAVSISVNQGLASARINAAGNELAAALRATRTQAIVQAREQVFALDVRDATYRTAQQREVRLPKGLALSVTSALADRPDAHAARIRFFPDGSSTGGHIVLRSGARQWRIEVSWLTGQVAMRDVVAAR